MPRPKRSSYSPLLLLGLCAPLIAAEMLAPGQAAPEFHLLDAHGQSHRLTDYAGHWLVLYFYPKNDTPGCTTEACSFRDDLILIHQLDAKVVGVSMDSQDSHKRFSEKYSLPFPLLSDPDGDAASRYGALGGLFGFRYAKRHTFLIDPQGLIRHIWRDVKPAAHTGQVIDVLKQQQAP